jgi:hypothetical protein
LRNHLNNMLEASFNSRVVFPFLLLLMIVGVDHFFIRRIFAELDILEHFLFGFIISEAAGRFVPKAGIEKWLIRKISKKKLRQLDLFFRLLGFLIIGGLLWESLEYFLFPVFGVQCNPFLAFPITLHNIDGTIDVAAGILGCMLAWHTAKRTEWP